MDLNQIPLFAMLKGKLSYTSQRQRVIAENVANADVPNYGPRDLKPFTFNQALQATVTGGGIEMARTSGAHMALSTGSAISIGGASVAGGQDGIARSPDSETRLDGNQVVLEEQMVKLSEARMDHDAAVGFYQQSLGLLKTALQKPGG